MKKFTNKLFLLLAITALLVPTSIVNAVDENGSGNSGDTTSPTVGETTGENQTGETNTTPTPSPTPETPKIEAKLSSLTVSGHTLKETFSKDTTSYTLTVKSDVKNIVVNATAGEGVSVAGTGSHDLKEGDNSITVTALSGEETTTYTIKVTRSTSDLSLKILSITGHPLNETFDPSVLDYTADVTYDTESVIVKAGANNSDARPQISGNSNLKVGKNTIRIVVKNSSGETQEYRIIVNRASEEETEENDDQTSSIASSEEITSSKVISETPNDSDNTNNDNSLKTILVVVFCILLLVIAGLGIYFYIRTGNSEKRKQKKIDKLKKKQAKIDQELTALLPVITDDMIEENLKTSKDTEAEDEFNDQDFEDTIELETPVEDEIEAPRPKKRVEKNILEDFDDLFLDE